MKLSKDDLVVVLSGNSRGVGPVKILSVSRNDSLVSVEGVNVRVKHVKRGHVKSPQGGRVEVCLPIHSSNVALYCKNCNRAVGVKSRVVAGRKCRLCCLCGSQF